MYILYVHLSCLKVVLWMSVQFSISFQCQPVQHSCPADLEWNTISLTSIHITHTHTHTQVTQTHSLTHADAQHVHTHIDISHSSNVQCLRQIVVSTGLCSSRLQYTSPTCAPSVNPPSKPCRSLPSVPVSCMFTHFVCVSYPALY